MIKTKLTGLSQILLVLVIVWFAYPILKELRYFFVEEFHNSSRWHDPGELFLMVFIVIVAAILAGIQNLKN